MVHIAAIMMVKNEHARIMTTLKTIVGVCKSLIVYDTGSTDDTVELIKKFVNDNNIRLNLIEGTFVDFSTSRNVLLDYCDKFDEVDYLLLLDCNDELRGGDLLLKEAKKHKDSPVTAFLVHQEWWSGEFINYYNVRLVKPRNGWRYKGVVHEFMTREKDSVVDVRLDEKVVLFQDRTADDDKSAKRFKRDKVLLLAEHEKNPKDTRTVHYLAQTFDCLDEVDDAYKYYKIRAELTDGFWEERVLSYLRCGKISDKKGNHDDAILMLLKACEIMPRAEALTHLAEIYRHKKSFNLAYIFASASCKLSYPKECTLSVDKQYYEYTRWHVLGIVAYYAGHYQEGKEACEKAIAYGKYKERDEENLKFYNEKLTSTISDEEKKLKEENDKKSKIDSMTVVDGKRYDLNTKNGNIGHRVTELSKKYPRLPIAKIIKIAKRDWKNEKAEKKE